MAIMTPEMAAQRQTAYELHAKKSAHAAHMRQIQQFNKSQRRLDDILSCEPTLTAEQFTFLIEKLRAAREHVS